MYFAIVGNDDKSLYECDIGTLKPSEDASKLPAPIKDLNLYITHAALDVVDEAQWETQSLYLKSVDKFYGYIISAFVTPGNVRFLLLHDSRNDESIKQFFLDLWDIYTKTILSPFYKEGDPLGNPHFNARVKQIIRKNL
ncbi:TRAPP subunit [Starmerella bacillaris]|uniref:TRAPP subunit n=1 Tax=Starmerella bacillaris TaxID=1247836 RepID=A0AAV5RJT9_STABA|nr:TRAPP subunit [Starmerella bacillaris]